MKTWQHYFTPNTLDEAVDLLARHAGNARIIAGGTDLLVDARASGAPAAETLIDITRIPELGRIDESDGRATIGAGVTHAQIVASARLKAFAACLVESCGVVGGPQVRNVATLGGNVAHALPAGDGTVSLVALDAEAEIVQAGERRWVPIAAMYRGAGESLLDSTRDILLRLRFSLCGPGEASAFSRIMRPQGVALPILGCAVWVRLDDARQTVTAARAVIAPVAPTPTRASDVEAALIGQIASDETIARAAQIGQESLHPRTSKYRATSEYRQEMIAVLLTRTLTSAFARARTQPHS